MKTKLLESENLIIYAKCDIEIGYEADLADELIKVFNF